MASITGTINGTTISGATATVAFTAVADATKTTISAEPTSIAANGVSTSTITVQAKDASGVNLTAGGDTVVLSTTAGVLGAVTDNHDGTYTATLTSAISAGMASITGTINGTTISGATATVAFTAVADATKTTISAEPTSIAANGVSTSTITVQAKDASGVNLTAGGDTVVLSTTAGVLGAVTDNHDGTYTATLTSAISAGMASITGTINGTTISGATATVAFTAVGSVNTPPPVATTPTITSTVVDKNTNQPIVTDTKATVNINADGTDTVKVDPTTAIIMQQPDGSKAPFQDYSKISYIAPATAPVTINADGTVQITNLAKGNSYDISVTYDLGNGQDITIGTIHISVDNSGNVGMTSDLIDPYGIMTDSLTGAVIPGAQVTLYYADTARNKANGKVAGTQVQLPIIDGFKPNNNQNPQTTDSNGAYGFMVYPNTDYSIVVLKDGYETFTSPTIAVADQLVEFSAKINESLAINTSNPSDGAVGTAYSYTFTSTGGTGADTYAVTSGSLPAGLTLDTNGKLIGIPTTSGAISFTIKATDSDTPAHTSSNTFTMTITTAIPLAINTSNPSDGAVGTAYSYTFTSTGGTGADTYAVTSGSLPAGLTLDTNGKLTGIPTTSGAITFTVKVTDSDTPAHTSSNTFTVTITTAVPLAINTSNPSDGAVGTAYSYTFTSTGGTGADTYAVTSGSLPAGLTLDTNGKLIGIPTTSGAISFTIKATDSGTPAHTSSNTFTVTITTAAPLAINTSNPSDGAVGTAYGYIFTSTGGTGADTYVVTSGSLPAGLTLDTNGKLIGIPTTSGAITFTVKATDSGTPAHTSSNTFTMTINQGTTSRSGNGGGGSGGGSSNISVPVTTEPTSTSTMVGAFTDSLTGATIPGAQVTLYYADTARNEINGKVAGTQVQLTVINGFNPNNNQNPQATDSNGTYGFKVYPDTDYYLVASKDGYDIFTSQTISVADNMAEFSAKMNPHVTGVSRIAGDSRVDTAIDIAKSEYTGKVKNVILATAGNYPDALAGSVLAYQQNAPILLVGDSQADQDKVIDYLKNNADTAGNVYVLGGTGVVSDTVVKQVNAAGFNNIVRLGGVDRYETDAKIADYLNVAEGTPVVIVSGENYPDVLSVSSESAVNQYPILLVGKDNLADSVKNELAKLKPRKVYIIGGTGVISDAAENRINDLTSLDSNNLVRIGGADRYETSLAVAKYFNLSGKSVCIATGQNFPDALAGSLYAANYNAPILLADGSLTESEKAYIQNSNLTGGATIFGGTGAVDSSIQSEVSDLMKMTITTATSLVINTSNPSDGAVGTAYSYTFTSTGGTGADTYVVTSGSLPAGLTLDMNGKLTGIPTTSGAITFTVKATDSDTPAHTSSNTFAMTINQGTTSRSGNGGGGSSNTSVPVTTEPTSTSTMVGAFTDSLTGATIPGAQVTLYYADTARNEINGKVAGTQVQLTVINGFNPNNNQNPQATDSNGTYGFKVYPDTDYYLVASKDGYDIFTSQTISVADNMAEFSAKMNPHVTGVSRIAGDSRVDTAIDIAKSEYTGKVKNVILATAGNYPDALAGSVLAYQQNAPILLVGDSQADQDKVIDYLKNNADTAGNVYVLGGTGVVSDTVVKQVNAAGFNNIVRLGGVDRYETDAKIADYLNVAEGTPVVIVSGENYPDVLSVSSESAVNQYPILLVGKDNLADSVKNELAKLKPRKVYIIGGTGVISDAAENRINDLTSLDSNNLVRIGGADRYETSLAVAKYFNLSGKSVCIATGQNFPDALAGSLYAANYNAPILLADGSLSNNEVAYLKSRKVSGISIFGGDGAVSQGIQQQLSQFMGQ
jgi:putative cell wall-binding protein